MDPQTAKQLYRSMLSGTISRQEYKYAVDNNGTVPVPRPVPFPPTQSGPASFLRSSNTNPQYGPNAFVQVTRSYSNATYVPPNQRYGSGPCGPCGPCEPCPCPNFCISNYGADLPFVDPDDNVLINLNTDYPTQFLALSSSPTSFMMAFSVPAQTRLTDNTVGVLRRIDPPYSNQFGNAYIHPYDGYTAIPMSQLTAPATTAVGPCQQGVLLLDLPTTQVIPPLGLSNSTGAGQQSYLIPMQCNPCLLQSPVEQLTAVQRVLLGIDLTTQTTFGECRIGPNSCRCIGQFLHTHTRAQNPKAGQYSDSDGLFIVLAWDTMVVIADTSEHDDNDQPITIYVNTLDDTCEAAWPLTVPIGGDNVVNLLNGSYINVDETYEAELARHIVVWTQNPSCMLPDKSAQFVEFCKYYEAKFNDIPFDNPTYVYPYGFFPKSRRIEQLLHARGQYKSLLAAIACATPPIMMARRISIPPPPTQPTSEQNVYQSSTHTQ